MDRQLKTKQRAIRAALRTAETVLIHDREVCLHIYASLGVITVFEAIGRKKTAVARFSWPAEHS